MDSTSPWRQRGNRILNRIVELIWVAIIYLLSELIIWGLSISLSLADLEFFASILGMLLLFCAMTGVSWLVEKSDAIYDECIRSKVGRRPLLAKLLNMANWRAQIDFINASLGMGFLVPIVTMGKNDILHGRDIARVIIVFFCTNIVSWLGVFLLSLAILAASSKLTAWGSPNTSSFTSTTDTVKGTMHKIKNSLPRSLRFHPFPPDIRLGFSPETTPTNSAMSSPIFRTKGTCLLRSHTERDTQRSLSSLWDKLTIWYPIILSSFCILAVGLPIAVATGDERTLDGFFLWLLWITDVKLVRLFKTSSFLASKKRLKSVLVALCNPVLMTTGLMMAYTRAKAAIKSDHDLQETIKTFSMGTPLRSLWTAAVTGIVIPNNPSGYFGAGDFALSLLECGMLVWGFKLFECRRQLFSVNGVLTVIIGTVAAVGNVLGSVVLSSTVGLGPPEALAFSARCATLALAKPAVQALGGNHVVNAIVVVGNGVFGQVILPFILDRLGVQRVSQATPAGNLNTDSTETLVGAEKSVQRNFQDRIHEAAQSKRDEHDSVMTVAAGVAIGVNGAAMGVSYLYENKSRAAPYAVLSMTIFGIVTVILTTVAPFKGFLLGLAQA